MCWVTGYCQSWVKCVIGFDGVTSSMTKFASRFAEPGLDTQESIVTLQIRGSPLVLAKPHTQSLDENQWFKRQKSICLDAQDVGHRMKCDTIYPIYSSLSCSGLHLIEQKVHFGVSLQDLWHIHMRHKIIVKSQPLPIRLLHICSVVSRCWGLAMMTDAGYQLVTCSAMPALLALIC